MHRVDLHDHTFRFFFYGFTFGVLTSILAGILYFLA